MKSKTISFAIVTVLVCLAFAGSGIANLVHAPHVARDMAHLGYPAYFSTILGTWKVLGAFAVAAPGLPRVKEWTYAGMMFDLTGAAISRAVAGDGATGVIPPLIVACLVVASWAMRPEGRVLRSLPTRAIEAPTLLEALLQLSEIFSRTSLTEQQRHLLLLTSSVENQCSFCVAAHTRGAKAGGVSADAIESIRTGAVPERAEDAAMVSFVRGVIRSRGFVSEAELKAFFDHGFTPRNALEVVLGVALKILTNYANHITHTELNPELSAYAWNAPS